MNQAQFLAEAKPMMGTVDSAFAKMFAPIQKAKRAPVTVNYEGIEWFVYGQYQPAEEDVGISCAYFESDRICFALDPDGRNLIDCLTQSTIDHLESLATAEYEGIQQGYKEHAIEQREEAKRDNSLTGD